LKPTHIYRSRTALCICLLTCGVSVGAQQSAPDAVEVARELFARIDTSHPSVDGMNDLLAAGQAVQALNLWRDLVVMRFREHDFGEYGWHGYVLHPRPAGAVDCLRGRITRDEYLNSGLVGFVDVYGMAGAPGTSGPINWFVDINSDIDWGSEELLLIL